MKRFLLISLLFGLGTLAFAQHYVALSWTQATDANVVYNNVYRGSQHGGPYAEIYSSASPITSYNDYACSGTCYYVVTAVNSNGESAISNEAEGSEGDLTTYHCAACDTSKMFYPLIPSPTPRGT